MTMSGSVRKGPFVVTGLSGSGKSVLSRSLEDIGYLCVDNIPLALVPDLFTHSKNEIEQLVVVLDVRTRGMAEDFPGVFSALKKANPGLRLVFVEASPETLLQRFSIARRPHPLRDRSLEDAIGEEIRALQPVRERADLIVDTTHLSPHDLRRQVLTLAGDSMDLPLTIEVESFSYLRGVPPTASLVFDVRFLPNPYFELSLRKLAGDDPEVAAWLDGIDEVRSTVDMITNLVQRLIPGYAAELKTHLSIAFGCTGGRHRSVFFAERMTQILREANYEVVKHHRDKDRWRYS